MLNYKIYDNQKDYWVVFLHGIGGSTKTWLRQIKSFSDKYNLLMIDLPGHGESQDIGDKVDINFVNDSIKEVLDFLNIQKADFIGLSMGTLVILNFATAYPQYVSSLILGGAIINLEGIYRIVTRVASKFRKIMPKETTYKVFANIIMPAKWHKLSRRLFFMESKRLNAKNFIAWVAYMTNFKREKTIIKKLKELKINICFISGEYDKCFISGIKHLSDKLMNSKFEIIRQCGHVCTIEKHKEFNERALNYLNLIHGSPVTC